MIMAKNPETVAVPKQNLITVTLYDDCVALCEEAEQLGTQVITLTSLQSLEALIRALQQSVEQWSAE